MPYRDIRPWERIGQTEWALPGTPWTVARDSDGAYVCYRNGEPAGRFVEFPDARRHAETMAETE